MKEEKKQLMIKLLVYFFIGMLVLTVISRAIDSVLVSKVEVGRAGSGNLSYRIEGSGVLQASKIQYLDVLEGYLVDWVIKEGTLLKEGDAILGFRMSDIEKKREQKEKELKKLQISLEQERLGGTPNSALTSQERVLYNLKEAERNYEAAKQQLYQAQLEYNEKMEKRHKKYKEAREKEEEKRNSMPQDEAAGQAYEAAVLLLEEEYESYEAQEREILEAAQEKERSMQNLVLQAQNTMELAKKEDEVNKKNEEKAFNISRNNQELILMDIEEREKELETIQTLISNQGEIKAPAAGTVLYKNIEEGTVLTGTEQIGIGYAQTEFAGSCIDEEYALLKAGDLINVSFQNGKKTVQARITELHFEHSNEGKVEFTALLPEGDYQIGMPASFSAEVKSEDSYSCLIPIQALRIDSSGKAYCLIAQKKNTILGEEYAAVRVPVTKLNADSLNAAVEDVFAEEDLIITGSSKMIKEGDRIRLP